MGVEIVKNCPLFLSADSFNSVLQIDSSRRMREEEHFSDKFFCIIYLSSLAKHFGL